MNKTVSVCLLMAAFMLSFKPVLAKEHENEVKGTAKVELKTVHAVFQNGEHDPNPKDKEACEKQVSNPNSKYLGHTVSTTYSINPGTLIMSASSTLPSPHSIEPLELVIPLHPLGMQGEYAFGAFKPAELPNMSGPTSEKLPSASCDCISSWSSGARLAM